MKEFDVTITEKLQTVVSVEAETAEEAKQMVSDQWRSGDHVLDAENFVDVDFDISAEHEIINDKSRDGKGMDILLVEPGQYPRMVTISGELESLQNTVGGYIQAIYPFDDPVAIVCDEEGKLNGAALNRALRDETGNIVDILAGPFFVCGLGEENFASLPNELTEKYESMFHQPESFLKLGSRIMAIPMEPAKQAPIKTDHSIGER